MKTSKIRIMSVCTAIATMAVMLASCADYSLSVSSDSLKPGNASKTEETSKVEATTEPQESETSAKKTQGTINFVIGDDGKIIGSPSDYDIEFAINGLKFTAAEYESNMEIYVNRLYDLLADDAPYKEERINSSINKAQTILKYSLDNGAPGLVCFSASAASMVIGYGTQGSHPGTDTSIVDFKMNGIKLGDNIEKVVECYGEPTFSNNWNCPNHWRGPDEEPIDGCEGHSYWYQFEDGSKVDIRFLGKGEIVDMTLDYPELNAEIIG